MKKTVMALCAFAITTAFGISDSDYNKFDTLDESGRYKEALAFLKPLAEAGDGRATTLIGYLYEVRFDSYGEGIKWYKKGMELNDSLAYKNMGWIYYLMRDYKLAAKTYEKASDLGNVQADAMIGNMYLNGIYYTRDYKKALVYIQRAAEKNNAQALTDLAICYENSYGVARDLNKARELYRRGAACGNKYAQKALGRL